MKIFKAAATNTSYPIYVVSEDIESALDAIHKSAVSMGFTNRLIVTRIEQHSEHASHIAISEKKR